MAGASVRISVGGAAPIERALARLAVAFEDFEPLMHGFGLTLRSSVEERFETETAPDGSAWTPSQRVKADGGKTLTLSGQLGDSVSFIASARQVEIGTNKVYAGVHQLGFSGNVTVPTHTRTIDQAFGRPLRAPIEVTVKTFERAMKMPARPFLGLSAEDETELLAQVEDYARDALGGEA